MIAPTRSSYVLAVLVTAAAVLVGCSMPVKPIDEERLQVLRAEARAVDAREYNAYAGVQIQKDAPLRTALHATFADVDTADPVSVARQETAKAITTLRTNGWTMYYVTCSPPSPRNTMFNAWVFEGDGYKIIKGVSYFVQTAGSAKPSSSEVHVSAHFFAPYSEEAAADLFPDRPPATKVGASCVEQATPPAGAAYLGTPTVMADEGPKPGETKAGARR